MTEQNIRPTAAAAGTFALGDLNVNRIGFGAMRITGKGIWGPPDVDRFLAPEGGWHNPKSGEAPR